MEFKLIGLVFDTFSFEAEKMDSVWQLFDQATLLTPTSSFLLFLSRLRSFLQAEALGFYFDRLEEDLGTDHRSRRDSPTISTDVGGEESS